ncbi:2-hydroxy-3-oxopropionate reductase [Streptomyces sp. SID14478]|uniref:2-hydroxy-3-oxopropionate reductase n=1 Tax=Streptomyces sp. SID14478 TaxID=2706073 RepID=UPI0013DB1665|nr:2-hydroxy-3-oxopropionate reductase [Streptomyces sp. SID14478]NEB74757.1 2-hydroxy-3-oxopropionate reductase [Streptomyces sp. SID14478]
MADIAFIGLGIMGSPMAVNLVRAGHRVTGWNRTPEKAAPLVEAGGKAAASIAEAVRDADVVITMVPAGPQVEQVAYGPDGILAHARPGALLIDHSSIPPHISVALAEKAKEYRVRVLDAPVSGGEAGAVEGVLSVMVGGDPADFEAARPVFEAVGRTVVHCGPHGSGQTVKAANQMIVAVNLQACAEAVTFLRKSGVDLAAALEVLGGGLAGSTVLARKKDNFLRNEFTPGFKVALHHKDMGIAAHAARAVGAVVPVTAVAAQQIATAQANGWGELDHSVLLRVVEQLSGPTD